MIFDRFFKPYAEYCLRTTLSEDELKTAVEKEFSEYDFLSGIEGAFREETVNFFKTDRPLTVRPVLRGRNNLRGVISIRCRKAEPGKETVLDITIAPRNDRWLAWGILGFCIISALIFCFGMWQGVFPLLGTGFLFLNLAASRSFADSEIPVIEQTFADSLRKLEKKYKDKKQ